MKRRLRLPESRLLKALLLVALCLFLLLNIIAALVIFKPRAVIIQIARQLSPNTTFTSESVKWDGPRKLEFNNVRVGDLLTIPKVTIQWQWKNLLNHHFDEIRITNPEIFVDLQSLSKLGTESGSDPNTASGSMMRPWFIDHLVLERGGLMMVGLGPTVPPLKMEIEGEFDDVPLGQNLSEEGLNKPRELKLNHIYIHSPLDLAITLLHIDSIVLEFHIGGIKEHRLDSLTINKPTLDIDRGFFWFVEELRRSTAENRTKLAAKSAPVGPEWTVGLFKIADGKLDINRLREIRIQYPFGFETTKRNMPLRNLSLADFAIDLDIREQDLDWPAKEIFFKKIRGKIAFNLADQTKAIAEHEPGWKPPNDVVNTLYVDTIQWKKLFVNEGWVTLTFDPKTITGMYGGSFSDGYISGGMAAGWSGNEEWRTWGSAADVNVKVISDAFSNESFGMDGRAQFSFDAKGIKEKLLGDIKLTSLSQGTIEIRSLDNLLDKIQKNTEGIKRELLQAFVSNLRNYPYRGYELDVHYDKPDARLTLKADSELGSRNLDVNWHGLRD